MKRSWQLLAVLCLSLSLLSGQEATQADLHHAVANAGASTSETVWADLATGNHRYMDGTPKTKEFVQLRHSLLKGQHPKAVVLACSDSRVPPELLFDQSLGDLFVVRAAGNVADAFGLGSIEYAVEHLGSSVLVVLGHEKCGAVTAACAPPGGTSPNLRAILDQIHPAVAQAQTYAHADALVDAAIRENIHQSANDVLARSEVLRHAVKEGKLTVIEAIYRLDSGEVVRLGKPTLTEPAARLDAEPSVPSK